MDGDNMEYSFKTKEYYKCDEFKHIDLDSLYNGDPNSYELLDYDLNAIIYVEAPITLNILKERMREVFDVKKISSKALEIILKETEKLGFITTDNLFDVTYWTPEGVFKQSFIRTGYQRQIYDIPLEEISLISRELKLRGIKGEAHHRAILDFFGYEVLTEKANTYLDFVMRRG